MFEQQYAREPGQIPHLFAEAWNAYDALSLANLFDAEAEFVNVVGLWWHDREAIFKAHDYGLKKIFDQSTLRVRQVKVNLITPEVALVHARMQLSGQTPQGSVKVPGRRQNIFSFVAKKEPDGWVILSAHNTDIVPGKETHIVDEQGELQTADYRPE